MTKKVKIVEVDVEEIEPEETREDILQAINTSEPDPPAEPTQQIPATKQRVNNLIKWELCGKYLTTKSLNYSHDNLQKVIQRIKTNQNRPKNQYKRYVNQFRKYINQNQSKKYISLCLKNTSDQHIRNLRWNNVEHTWRKFLDLPDSSPNIF